MTYFIALHVGKLGGYINLPFGQFFALSLPYAASMNNNRSFVWHVFLPQITVYVNLP